MGVKVTLDTQIEDLVRDFPESVGFLTRRGIRCIRCGEPLWCTLGELLQQEGKTDARKVVDDLNVYLNDIRSAS
jgi:hypothetical protein